MYKINQRVVAVSYKRSAAYVVFAALALIAMWAILQNRIAANHIITNRVSAQTSTQALVEELPPPELTLEEKLLEQISLLDEQIDGELAVYVEHLETGSQVALNEKQKLKTASLYKAFIANEAFAMIDAGDLELDQIIDEERELTLEECLDIMITVSDNECGVILQKTTGALDDMPQLRTQGFRSTVLSGDYPTSTAEDVALLFKNLQAGSDYLSEESNKSLLDLFKNQKITNRIPKMLPDEVTVAHKTGNLEGIVHDAGIVYTNQGPYVIVMMTSDLETTDLATSKAMTEFSANVYRIFTEG